MPMSPQWPDLEWIPARAFTRGRVAGKPVHITIHETDNPTSSARGEASWMQRRPDRVSAHYVVDEVELIQCVRTTDTAHTAFFHGNRDGIHYEFCGVSGRADTADAQLRLAAQQMARDMATHGIPLRRLTVAGTRQGVPGFNAHADVTRAWPEDGGTHTDPGSGFPWDRLFDYIAIYLVGETMVDETNATEESVWRLLDTGKRGQNETGQHPKPGGGTHSRPNNWLVRTLLEAYELAELTGERVAEIESGVGQLLTRPAPPVTLPPEQLAELADLVAARLRALTFVGQVPA